MLPLLHCQRYENFVKALGQLKEHLITLSPESAMVREYFYRLQQVYQEQIATLDGEGIEPERVPRWQSVQTEIKRAFRLLQTEIMFLQASRQTATQQQRQETCLEEIERLQGYCHVLLKDE
ncbi:heterocyst frequency control protein PatD [Lusitaniella coriacea LEGE 07157]|uniref:Heterocyst frequency control protein PatD n=1 Tax=Lusitaniella coriacea LEGE 07157 TaxID=945747 RepID=A0A8J7J565_9CYAN|nr:heterocyst frequency control protein PatD [Lusitaniella coriacea]MBE9117829.1 heterocyst frequency control protein PatD [Lusitaniella coriacea LEGE 07157]